MDLFQKYRRMNIDGGLISLEYAEITVPYFCYPENAIVIGFEGSILYCFLPEYSEMVFAANPETCVDSNVYPLAKNFADFMRLVITCGSANPVEQIVWMNEEQFTQHIQNEATLRTAEQNALLKKLRDELQLAPMDNPFEYVKELQASFDGSKIRYSVDYYETLGIPVPGKPDDGEKGHCFEFEPVIFKFERSDTLE